MNETKILDILNNGEYDALIALPGIGPALANRLIAARPFDSLIAVETVKGMSANLLKQLSDAVSDPDSQPQDQVTDEISAEPEIANEAPPESHSPDLKERLEEGSRKLKDGLSDFGEAVKNRGKAARQSLEELPQKLEEVTKSPLSFRTILISSFITALVTIILTLIVLGSINGSLKFATSAQVQTMQREASQLSAQVDTLGQDLSDLRGRVDLLEGLGERTVALEMAQEQLTASQEAASQQMADLQTNMDALDEKVTLQEERTQRFETFLKDLQTMLSNLFTAQGEN